MRKTLRIWGLAVAVWLLVALSAWLGINIGALPWPGNEDVVTEITVVWVFLPIIAIAMTAAAVHETISDRDD